MNRITCTLLLFFVHIGVLSAQWTTDSTLNTPVCTDMNLQNNVRIAGDGYGGAVVVWQDQRDAGNSQTDIYAQRLDSAGYAQWQPQGIAVNNAAGLQQQLNIAADGVGGVAAVWRDQFRGIMVQHVRGDGVLHWNPAGVVLSSYRNYLGFPQIIRDQSGGFIAAWSDDRDVNNNIYAQAIDTNGVVQWISNGVRLKPINVTQSQPVMIPRDSGGAIVVWMESGLGIVAQAIASDGTLPWGNAGRVVCSLSGGGEYPKLVSDGNNGAIIAWTDSRPGGNGSDIYAQHISNAGNALWTSEGSPMVTAPGNQSEVAIVADGAGGAIISWEDGRAGAPGIYAQRVTAGDTLLWQSNGIPVCTLPAATPSNPRMASDDAGGSFIVWEDSRNPSREDLYMQHVLHSGVQLWYTDGMVLTQAERSQSSQRLIADGDGNAIVAWEDARDNGIHSDIYAAKITAEGRIPVEFSLFRASLIEDNVHLHWVTESETNSYEFSIERAVDGGVWRAIGTVRAAGTTSARNDYFYTDTGPFSAGIVSYRLRQIDTDGTYSYSTIASVVVGNASAFEILSLYPHPATSEATLRISLPDAVPLRIGVYTTLGTLMSNIPVPAGFSSGVHELKIPTAALPAGRYIVSVSGPIAVRTVPLIVQE